MKKIYKIAIILILITTIYSFFYTSNATTGIWDTAKDFLNTGKKHPGMTAGGTADTLLSLISDDGKLGFAEIIDFVWGLGLLTIFISTIILGIRYIFVDPAERSRIKQATAPYILGVVIIFGAVTIWRLIIIVLDGSLLG